jgi:RNA polymerase sigma-70 factor, ECF subfamily
MSTFAQLVEAEIPRLRRYARAVSRDRDSADDLVQETLVRALEKAHLWQAGTNLRAWLFTLMHNQYVNIIRRSARQGRTVDPDRAQLVSPAAQHWPLELRDLERAIARLPRDQRETLLLVGLEAMKYDAVAEVCGVPIGTVRSRLCRARQTLRDLLEGTEEAASPYVAQRGTPRARQVPAGLPSRPPVSQAAVAL